MLESAASLGYGDAEYVLSLSQWGAPRRLEHSRGWLLDRLIPDTGREDAMGPYPLFTCADWSGLHADLEALHGRLVSVVVVVDPLAETRKDQLRRAFPDHLVAFKRHMLRDLEGPYGLPVHHRRNVRRAARAVDVEVCDDPPEHLDEWVALYAGLVARHGVRGIRAFSRAAFWRQLRLPGLHMVRATRDGETVAMALWIEAGEYAYYHLGASSDRGYEVGASYAVFAAAFDHLRRCGVRRVDLGGTAGSRSEDDGLNRFKRGWASHDKDAWLGGRILDRAAYARISALHGTGAGWFPAYRAAATEVADGTANPMIGR